MKKQPKITETTRDNLVKAFWSIYKEKDISKITATEIIKKAGYNRSTFYCYFENVQAVLNYYVFIVSALIGSFLYWNNNKDAINEFDFFKLIFKL